MATHNHASFASSIKGKGERGRPVANLERGDRTEGARILGGRQVFQRTDSNSSDATTDETSMEVKDRRCSVSPITAEKDGEEDFCRTNLPHEHNEPNAMRMSMHLAAQAQLQMMGMGMNMNMGTGPAGVVLSNISDDSEVQNKAQKSNANFAGDDRTAEAGTHENVGTTPANIRTSPVQHHLGQTDTSDGMGRARVRQATSKQEATMDTVGVGSGAGVNMGMGMGMGIGMGMGMDAMSMQRFRMQQQPSKLHLAQEQQQRLQQQHQQPAHYPHLELDLTNQVSGPSGCSRNTNDKANECRSFSNLSNERQESMQKHRPKQKQTHATSGTSNTGVGVVGLGPAVNAMHIHIMQQQVSAH